MKKLFATMCFAMACSVAALAQTYPAAPADKGQMDKDKKDGTVIVTGCVAQGDTEGQFRLTNAVKADPKTSPETTAKPAGTSGATPGAAPMTMSYDVIGGGDELKAHVGHKIEATGTTDTMPKMDTMPDTAKPEKDAAASKDIKGGKLTLTSFKMLSAVCP
jgi:hypothetical protein